MHLIQPAARLGNVAHAIRQSAVDGINGVAGDDGECILSREDLAALAMMSTDKCHVVANT